MIRILVQIILMPFPWQIRRYFYIKLWGYSIAKSARIKYSVILAKKLVMNEGAIIGNLSFCKNIDLLYMGANSRIGNSNRITGFSTDGNKYYKHRPQRKCELILGNHSAITMNHLLDCNGGITIGEYTTVAGYYSQILTHSIDVYTNRQDVGRVTIGDYCLIGTGCILLLGSEFPSYSVLGAGSVLTKKITHEYGLYAGAPAKLKKILVKDDVQYFKRDKGFVN